MKEMEVIAVKEVSFNTKEIIEIGSDKPEFIENNKTMEGIG